MLKNGTERNGTARWRTKVYRDLWSKATEKHHVNKAGLLAKWKFTMMRRFPPATFRMAFFTYLTVSLIIRIPLLGVLAVRPWPSSFRLPKCSHLNLKVVCPWNKTKWEWQGEWKRNGYCGKEWNGKDKDRPWTGSGERLNGNDDSSSSSSSVGRALGIKTNNIST